MFQPGAPVSLTLESVDAHSAVITWTAPNATGVATTSYYVQLRRGNADATWTTVVSGTAVNGEGGGAGGGAL